MTVVDYLGYEDLPIPDNSPRTKKLQQVICRFLDADGTPNDADRIALLGMLHILGELEHSTQHSTPLPHISRS